MTTLGSGSATAAPQFTDHDFHVAASLLQQEYDEPVAAVLRLTDEELLAVEGIQHRQLLPLPWAAKNLDTDVKRAVATATAMRSLISRGLVNSSKIKDPRTAGGPGPDDEVADVLRGTVVARRTSEAVVVTERTTTEGKATGIFYVFDLPEGQKVLWEVYDDQGAHTFYVMDASVLPEQFILFADPVAGIGEEDAEPQEIAASAFPSSEIGKELGQARAATSVAVRAQDDRDDAAFTIFSLLDRAVMMETGGEGADAHLRLGTISRSTLSELVTSLVEPGDDSSA